MECPACHSKNVKHFTKKNDYDLYRCQRCGSIFMHPIPENIDEVYSADYFSGASRGFGYVDYDKDKEAMAGVFVKYLKIIEKYAPKKGELLDVGTATGYFMEIAKQRGWKADGIEISEYAAGIGRRKGLDIKIGSISTAGTEPDKYDVITMWDVLEHFSGPAKEIVAARRLLKPGGILIANTPDSASLYARIMGTKWYSLLPPEHIVLFNKKSLEIFLAEHGFTVLEFAKIGKIFSLQYILQIISNWLKLEAFNKFARSFKNSAIGNLAIPLNLRDNILVIARKNN